MEDLWIKAVQKNLVENRLQAMEGAVWPIHKVWRCGGRLGNAELPLESKYTILLPREHRYTRLVVLKAHNRVIHNGVKETLTEVRRDNKGSCSDQTSNTEM